MAATRLADTRVFNNDSYLKNQNEILANYLDESPPGLTVVEVGGKPFGDYHAARVLPGYDPDCKGSILKQLQSTRHCDISFVVNASDILYPPFRFRGDTGFRYDVETARLVNEARDRFGLEVNNVAIASAPRVTSAVMEDRLRRTQSNISKNTNVPVLLLREIPGYPNIDCLKNMDRAFGQNDRLSRGAPNLILLSPGSGSGKFSAAISELYKKLAEGGSARLVKLETFPIRGLSAANPLNIAFEAAVADTSNGSTTHRGRTISAKDEENLALLRVLSETFPYDGKSGLHNVAEDFALSTLEDSIFDLRGAAIASVQEIRSRVRRYTGKAEAEVTPGEVASQTSRLLTEAESYLRYRMNP